MTTRLKGVYVAFDKDIREDDAQSIINAIMMIKGVLNVDSIESEPNDWINRQRIGIEYQGKIIDALKELK